MKSMIVKLLKRNKFVYGRVLTVKKLLNDLQLYTATSRNLKNADISKRTIYYLGIPAHNNLGDLAQGVCIRAWIKKNYSECTVVEIETNALVNTKFSVLNKLKVMYKKNDLIIFQSGYTTTDLGGYADIMHKAVIGVLPEAHYLMMPQTIFFQSEERKKQTAQVYSTAKNMLFLARDRVSYDAACNMFKGIRIELYPDIVTTLIGKYSFDYERSGIMLCARNDGEKYYSEEQLQTLIDNCKSLGRVDRSDTTKDIARKKIVQNAERYINAEIDTFAHYKLTITDRYHGTILSLAAGTPVIIIKTTDHKVVTGADWFKGVYSNYVYVAEDLDDAYVLAKKILAKDLSHRLDTYFENEYYDKLKGDYEGCTNENM